MSAINELLKGSFRGVPFLLTNSEVNTGRKHVVNDYVGSNKRYIEDLGLLPEIFRCDFTLPTNINNYYVLRNRMNKALTQKGSGQLIHPYYGIKNVFVTNQNIYESDSSLGIIRYSVEFSVVQKNTAVSFNDINSIFNLADNLFTSLEDAYDELYIASNSQNLLNFSDKFSYFLNRAQNIVNTYSVDAESFKDFFNSYRLSFERSTSISFSGKSIGQATSEVLRNASTTGIDQTNNLKIQIDMFEIFNEEAINIFPNSYDALTYCNNLNGFYEMVNIMSLTNAYKAIANYQFYSITDLNFYLESIKKQYQKILSLKNKMFSPDILEALNDIRTLAINSIINQQSVIEENRDVFTNPIALLTFVYKYYGNLDNTKNIININNFDDVCYISGNVKVRAQ